MRTPRFRTARFTTVACLLSVSAAIGAGDGRRGTDDTSPPGSTESAELLFYSALAGANAGDVALPEGILASEDVIMVYQHQFGIYPSVTMEGEVTNGGVPQNVNIQEHLRELERDINIQIPADYSGYVIIDYEEWHPFWEDTATRYRNFCVAQVRAQKPTWDDAKVERKARKDFEKAAKKFIMRTLDKCRQLRPDAKWGIWAYPKARFRDNNARWLWKRHDAFFPTIYMMNQLVPDGVEPGLGQASESAFIEDRLVGRVAFASEIAGDRQVMTVMWPKYSGNNENQALRYQPLSPENLTLALELPFAYGADGMVIWDNIPQPGIAEAFQELLDYRIAPEIRRILTDMGLPTDGLENEVDPGDSEEPIEGLDDGPVVEGGGAVRPGG